MKLMCHKNKVKIIEESNCVYLSKKLQMILLHTYFDTKQFKTFSLSIIYNDNLNTDEIRSFISRFYIIFFLLQMKGSDGIKRFECVEFYDSPKYIIINFWTTIMGIHLSLLNLTTLWK